MKTFKKIAFVLVNSFLSLTIYAQQDPMYTHYMDNTLVINPGYAGSRDALSITALHRSQWVNYKGAPITQTIMFHTPLRNEHIGVGLSVMNDKIGPTNKTSVFGDFAYRLNLTKKSKLAFGLSAGANIFKSNLNTVQLDQQSDPIFQNNINNKITPNFGFGVYYSRERFYAGLSTPNLVQNNYSEVTQTDGTLLVGKEQRHFFFIAGTVFNLTDKIDFKPTTFVKLTTGAPIQADVTATFIFRQKLLLGAMYRTGDSFGGLIGFNITPQFHVGYSFDWSYGVETFKYNQGSHEIILRFDLMSNNQKQIHTPRYF